jgi:hypothetical protein
VLPLLQAGDLLPGRRGARAKLSGVDVAGPELLGQLVHPPAQVEELRLEPATSSCSGVLTH